MNTAKWDELRSLSWSSQVQPVALVFVGCSVGQMITQPFNGKLLTRALAVADPFLKSEFEKLGDEVVESMTKAVAGLPSTAGPA